MEIPIDVVREVTERAGGIVILNPAPATPLDADALSGVDYLIPNRTELATLAGCPAPGTEADILAAIRSLAFDGTVIVTLGGDGAIATAGGEIVVRATPPDVPVVDTVGAGDAFCGGFAASIARGESLSTAIGFAVACGAHATTIRGAQPSMPSYGDAEALVASVAVDTIDTWNE
jgi:ribokinase